MRFKPFIESLLETDLYKFSMGQAIYHQFSDYKTTLSFKCRNENVVFTPEMVDDLRMAISERLEIEPQEVQISATGTPQYRTNEFEETQRRGIIRYRIEVPMKQLMAGGSLFGISKEANQGTYVIEGIMASERLPF